MTATLTSFAVLGAVTTAQQIAGRCLESMEGADPELVAEETLALLSVTTARTLREHALVAETLAQLPLTYRDYVVGGAVLSAEDQSEAILSAETASYERLGRKLSFYEAHFPPGKLPGPRALKDKMELWMGRISPPGLPESPRKRMEKLQLVSVVETHLKLVRAFAEQDRA
ncbi:MAG: hypothetical protein JJ896_02510 [Rhodothermales bacterium]|nr:hypothetical protein [Rhodothermales bacterium]MBO6778503.1 hypothetical protein [Rhodothermales bacterium]